MVLVTMALPTALRESSRGAWFSCVVDWDKQLVCVLHIYEPFESMDETSYSIYSRR